MESSLRRYRAIIIISKLHRIYQFNLNTLFKMKKKSQKSPKFKLINSSRTLKRCFILLHGEYKLQKTLTELPFELMSHLFKRSALLPVDKQPVAVFTKAVLTPLLSNLILKSMLESALSRVLMYRKSPNSKIKM